MIPLLPTRPVTDMNRVPNEVLAMLVNNPVVLMQRSQPAAVMIQPDKWNDIAQELNDLRALVAALRAEQELSDPDAWTVEHAADPVPA